jgi:hypothetical protein
MPENPIKKLDLRKQLKHLYSASASRPETIEVPQFNYIMIDGRGDPSASDFSDAIGALYSLSYTLKFKIKKEKAIDYPVMALEGLWWGDFPGFNVADKASWNWTAMIMQPKPVTQALFRKAVEEATRKKDLKALGVARLEALHEGLSAQVMHVGPYSAAGPTIERLHDYIKVNGGRLRGKHHEIYLGDPRRAASSKLRTIMRQPFEIVP